MFDPIEELLAIESIRNLKARYLNACDLKDADTLLDCFVDGEVEINYGHIGEFTTREDFVELFLLAADHEHILDMHQGGNAEIEIVSKVSAKARWNFDYRNINTQDESITLASGIYHDEYRWVKGAWKISKTSVHYGTALHFSYKGGQVGGLFAGKSVAGVVEYGDEEN